MTVQIRVGHVLDELARLPAESVHCIWTSVPYFGLRSYKTAPQVWGGDPGCAHKWGEMLPPRPGRGNKPGDLSTSSLTNPERQDAVPRATDAGTYCARCYAWRGEHGLEPSLALWIKHEVLIWRELRRVLRTDGVAWLNVGDAYASDGGAGGGLAATGLGTPSRADTPRPEAADGALFAGLGPKQRLMLPARLAIALQDDGWVLRDEIIWAKANPMPSSTSDRTTPAHEMLYMLAKTNEATYWTHRDGKGARGRRPAPDYRWIDHASDDAEFHVEPEDWRTLTTSDGRRRWSRLNLWRGHDYFYDAEAIREGRTSDEDSKTFRGGAYVGGELDNETMGKRQVTGNKRVKMPDGWDTGAGGHGAFHREGREKGRAATVPHGQSSADYDRLNRRQDELHDRKGRTAGNKSHKYVSEYDGSDSDEHRTKAGLMQVADVPWFSRQKRSVWPMASEPMREAHFATAPTKLVEPCILAGTSAKGVCSICGAPWTRMVDSTRTRDGEPLTGGWPVNEGGVRIGASGVGHWRDKTETATRGWAPTCGCEGASIVPATVLDPFLGSGTTAVVADRLQRNAIGIELNPEYAAMARRRIEGELGGLLRPQVEMIGETE